VSEIKVGSFWVLRDNPSPTWTGEMAKRVMAIVENYVVVRYKGCHPTCIHYKDFLKQYSPAPARKPRVISCQNEPIPATPETPEKP
jgi:hypothetical protein